MSRSKPFFQRKKINSLILFFNIFLFLFSIILISTFIDYDIYSSTPETEFENIYLAQAVKANNDLFSDLTENYVFKGTRLANARSNVASFFQDGSRAESYRCSFELVDETSSTLLYVHAPGRIISSQDYVCKYSSSFYVSDKYASTDHLTITCYVNGMDSLDLDFYKRALFIQWAFFLRYPVLISLLPCGIFILLSARNLLLYYRKFQAPIKGAARMPMEFAVALFGCVSYFLIDLAQYLDFSYPLDTRLLLQSILAVLLVGTFAFSILRLLITVLRRMGNHTLRSTCLLLVLPPKALRSYWKHMSRFSLTFRGLLLYALFVFLEVIFFRLFRPFQYAIPSLLAYLVVFHIVILCGLWYLLFNVDRLWEGVEAISNEKNLRPFDGKRIYGTFLQIADAMTNMGTGLTHAVEEQMKSERLKTELITNVSHDIKTPLTSIINYVDLLKKEPLDNKKAAEYIEVLDRQSLRLKKLILDLIEASKATTGNIEMHLQRCKLNVLLEQLLGEYADRLNEKGLTPVVSQPQEPICVMADGQYLWRCMDNLMINICKYSLEQTRVYVSLEAAGGRAVVTFKNISQSPLNVSPHTLMERFVRGDSSRSTEGNGLGLSITQSLMKLQNGALRLDIDGDLFKAVLSFPLLPAAKGGTGQV